ncbi:MAG: response regulator [Magnetococcales bacterium]|nr:response regulator [Magnetococcales bacterium]
MNTQPTPLPPDSGLEPPAPPNPEILLQMTRHLEEGLYILDQGGYILFVNEVGERLLGWSHQELLGKNPHEIFHFQNASGECVPVEACPILQCVQRGEIFRTDEDVFTHRDGHLIPVSVISFPIFERQRVTGSFALFKDLNLRKQWEREIKQARDIALETARLKSEFLANMSHEIRTPINGVIGMTDLLLDSKLNKEQKELATTVRESAQALLTIVNDILDFSSLEAGRMESSATPFSPLKVVEEVAELLASQAQQKNLDLLTDVSPKLPNILLGNPARLRQVLLNLVGNAVKFTKKGEVVIQARLTEKTKAPLVVRFAVTDTGIGIPKSSMHRLFQPFTQVDGSTTRAYGGMGLGLSIANRLVELMGGEMGMISRRGKGSTFWFTVPFPLSSQTVDLTAAPLTYAPLKGVKALVVDPRQTSQTILLNHLLSWNMKCAAVESPAEALVYLKHEAKAGTPCDLLLLAATPIPLEECLEMGRNITNDPELPPIGLILITGIHEKKWFDEARKVGFVTHLTKPLHRHHLLDCLLSVLNPDPPTDSEPGISDNAPLSHRVPLSPPRGEEKAERLILLAEDNAVNQKVAQMQINRLGYTVHTVANGKDAIHALQSGSYAMVLMDCHMPILDGLQATHLIRQQEGADNRSRTPIIALTSNALPGDVQRCLAHGMDDTLNKPIRIEELAEKLDQWLPGRQCSTLPVPDALEAQALPPISIEQLKASFGDDPKVITEFIETFLSTASLIIAKLKKNLKIKDAALLEENVHELKGASANMGAHFMSRLCTQLQETLKNGDFTQCRLLIEQIQKEFRRCETFIRKI